MSPPPRRHPAGFTLVELVVVIAIMAVLVSIAIPVMSRIKERARASACATQLRGLGAAVNLYLADHNMTFPTLEAGRASTDDDVPVIDNTLDVYVDDPGAFECPADRRGLYEATGTSYFWNNLLNGQRTANANLLGLIRSPKGIPVISDKENFHKWRGHEVNILYADGHVDKELKFNVER